MHARTMEEYKKVVNQLFHGLCGGVKVLPI
jgi:hypothetical protein